MYFDWLRAFGEVTSSSKGAVYLKVVSNGLDEHPADVNEESSVRGEIVSALVDPMVVSGVLELFKVESPVCWVVVE